MGIDRIRHLVERKSSNGTARYYWQPSATIQKLNLDFESLGTDFQAAKVRALELNRLADETRISAKSATNGPLPGSVAKLFREFQQSEEFSELKERTRRDYSYYLNKIELDFGSVDALDLTPRILDVYYKRVRREKGVVWAYHIMSTFRATLSWAVRNDWIPANPALAVKIKLPPKRKVIWRPEHAPLYIQTAHKLKWHSIAVMAHVFDSIGQSPVDVRTLSRGSYDGRCIDVDREKTGEKGAPIPLFPEAKAALDNYLSSQPAKLPDAPLFTHDRKGGIWNKWSLNKVHAVIRKVAGLPFELQLQDFRRTAQTEGGASGGTVDELRGLARHATRSAAEHYVHPDKRYIESIQAKRLAGRNKGGANVE